MDVSKFRLAAVCLAAVCLPVHAAELTPYGQIHAAYTYFDSEDGAHGSIVDDARQGSHAGIAVEHPISDTLTGLGRFELGFNPTAFDDDPVHGRQAWVALRGALGRVGAGRFAGLYGITGGRSWDLMTGTVLEQRRNGGMSGGDFGHDGFLGRLVEYRSPALGGLELMVQAGLDQRGAEGAADGDLLLGARYREENWELIGAYARNTDLPADRNHNWKLGARYAVGAGTLAYQYEKTRIPDTVATGTVKHLDDALVLTDQAFSSEARRHFLGISQQLPGAELWLAWGYLDARDDRFDLQNYTLAVRVGSGSFRWYAGLQQQNRDDGYETGKLLISATGFQLMFR